MVGLPCGASAGPIDTQMFARPFVANKCTRNCKIKHMQNAQIAGRSFGFAHFLELRPSCGKLRPSSGKLRSSCGFVFSRALHQASRQPQKVLELDLSREKRSNAKKLSGALFCVSKGPPGGFPL